MNRVFAVFLVAAFLLVALATSLLSAAPEGPRQERVLICHYCEYHEQYITLEVGPAGEAMHLANHPDVKGACE